MDMIDVLADFGPLDALEQNIENGPIPGDMAFQDPLCQMLNELEQGIEASEVKPPPMPEEPAVLENQAQGFLPPQEAGSEQGTGASPPLPYYIEGPQQVRRFHAPPYRQRGRIGRAGGTAFGSSHAEQPDQRYCPIEKGFVSMHTCEDCDYYDEDGDPETGSHCTYYSEEES